MGENQYSSFTFKLFHVFFLLALRLWVTEAPFFCSTLDPQLQDELKQYLVTKGIGKSLTNFLLVHLHKKEQNQYENWLEKLKAYVAQGQGIDS